MIREVFVQPTQEKARELWRALTASAHNSLPKLAQAMEAAEDDVLAYMTFPAAHRQKLHSTNTLERLNKEIKRRTSVVGIFPTRASVVRLVGMVLSEQDDEWQDGRRYFRPETMTAIDAVPIEEVGQPLLLGGIEPGIDSGIGAVAGAQPEPLGRQHRRRGLGGVQPRRAHAGQRQRRRHDSALEPERPVRHRTDLCHSRRPDTPAVEPVHPPAAVQAILRSLALKVSAGASGHRGIGSMDPIPWISVLARLRHHAPVTPRAWWYATW